MKYSVICLLIAAWMLPLASSFAQTDEIESVETTSIDITTQEADSKKKKNKKDELTEEHRTRLAFEGIRSGDMDMARKYMFPQMVYKFDQDGENILTLAVKSGNLEMVKFIEYHSIINKKNEAGETPLTLALKGGDLEILAIILDRAKTSLRNGLGELPLILALEHDHGLKVLQALIDRGAELNVRVKGITPLYRAVELNKLPAVALFLKNGANPSFANADGMLPLTVAVQNNQEAIVGILLNKSENAYEDANWQNDLGEPILVLATIEGKTGIVETLVFFGADVNATDYMDNTALVAAAKKGNASMMQFLVENGADLNHQNMMGVTPLIAAAESGHYAAANYLATNGADVSSRSFAGIAATDFFSFTSSPIDDNFEETDKP